MHVPLSRRELLLRSANGFGAAALAALLADDTRAADARAPGADPMAPKKPHFAPKAKSVIFLFMDGGPSQIDTFDPKPALEKYHGKPFPGKTEPTQFNNVGNTLASPWKFKKYGQSGLPVSDLFPHVGACADDLAVIRSMVANFSEHTNANYFWHSGSGLQGRPSFGAWATYGLGSECRDLPGFVVLGSGMIPPGGADCFGNGFLPATYQGSVFKHGPQPVADIAPPTESAKTQKAKRDLLRKLDAGTKEKYGDADPLDAAIANYELAFRMQTAVPELTDLSKETTETQKLYGIDDKKTEVFGRQCLLARRLVQRGVRFVELLCQNLGHDRWDQHANLKKGHEDNARAVDKPIAGLLTDLKRLGLLNETLVIWGGEFGRTPMAQGTDGRDHNPFGFSMWMAGGGTKGGTVVGATDDFGYHAVQDKVQVHDLHATALHLLGFDHKKLTYRFGGRDMRLTDVHGELIEKVL
ncbi:hypothetical protein GobsT_21560 [Gemmata obscuriglobus]|uniref:DUF1501 domain-containing protein n=1 Tax=Gemmata obscuriglobus TaxID=114 RepID=A0A2Z3GYD0_9BACT|nr:DUF1501 domain-containing protein [Gemmata obscuriglobus]AWM39509.1 DUF1501 domain-containing protein [Gemmata obscuriglobus]QEG27400.1 hypothetical protein GobsT_21560 [Gemmata obscuriglobus]VTS04315.1 sulfatase : Uncharacterized protein OS=Singulisphaera acidiphila (strain ATCC BAA-1392 / DSM 18658 / VKM B-2454 / MOB10) GN=Sinac_1211 PE=4 SV=1: DUF1501 [Gemmata obscuriglobus UQM 2246]